MKAEYILSHSLASFRSLRAAMREARRLSTSYSGEVIRVLKSTDTVNYHAMCGYAYVNQSTSNVWKVVKLNP